MSAGEQAVAEAPAGLLRRVLPAVLTVGGISGIAVALAAELAGGATGFGFKQIFVTLMGGALVLAGAAARSPAGWEALAERWGAPARTQFAELGRFATVLAQVVLLLVLFRRLEIEGAAFFNGVAVLGAAGFVIHYFLPSSHRLTFFLLLGFAALFTVLGAAGAGVVVLVGGALVGICYLPLPFAARVGLLLAAAAVLTLQRAQVLPAPWSVAVWPVLGSLFMFRLIVFVYDLRHAREKPRPVRSLAYFFLLPNPLFALFPVVDWQAFNRTYYDADQYAIYQRGVRWMFRGLLHLLAYRVVYQYLTIAPNEVAGPADLARYLVANILLYLRVSGQFHLIVGLLHLFGFHLPRTNDRYFLAPSVSEYWRRINIYWKDFMMKVVFYPTYFALRRHGEKIALGLGTIVVIAVTWALHSYQWFWLLGRFPVSPTDLVFWGVLALLLAGNTLLQARRRPAADAPARGRVAAAALAALRTGLTFTVICVLWSVWTSPSLVDWVGLWDALRGAPVAGAIMVLGGIVLGVAVVAFAAILLGQADTGSDDAVQPAPARSLIWSAALFGALYLAASPALAERLGGRAAAVAANLRSAQLNRRDAAQMQRGYYEQLNDVSRVNSQLWELYMRRRVRWPRLDDVGGVRRLDSYLAVELVPSRRVPFGGIMFSTNRWGMRDREYAQAKAPGTFRLAVVGASTTMGWAVDDAETFENLLEDRLNRHVAGGGAVRRFESLNFSVPGYVPLMFGALVERSLAFAPDAVMIVTQDNDVDRTVGRLVDYVRAGTVFPDDSARALAAAAIRGTESRELAMRRLAVHGEEILTRYYRAIAEQVRAAGARPVWVYLPGLELMSYSADREALFNAARRAGFTTIDLTGVYDGRNPATLRVEEADYHPNAEGHRLVAQRLYQAIVAMPEFLTPARPAATP